MHRIHLPDPLRQRPWRGLTASAPHDRGAAAIVDRIIAAERQLARRLCLYHRLETGASAVPVRWQRLEPRPSLQYAGAMTTEAARDARLARGAVSLLLVLRARVGGTMRTETTKTTLAHILGASTRTIGRWLRDLVRFGYVSARPRVSAGGLYTGLVLELAQKVLPCFRKDAWLATWIACNAAAEGALSDRTNVSDTNHSFKESSFQGWSSGSRRP